MNLFLLTDEAGKAIELKSVFFFKFTDVVILFQVLHFFSISVYAATVDLLITVT